MTMCPWEGEYIAPIIGSVLNGCQLTGHPPREPLRIKGRLFRAVLAEGQLQLPVPAILPKKRFSEKASLNNTVVYLFINQSYRLSVNSREGKDFL